MASKQASPRDLADPLRMHRKAVTAGPEVPCDCTLSPNYERVSGVPGVSGASASAVGAALRAFLWCLWCLWCLSCPWCL